MPDVEQRRISRYNAQFGLSNRTSPRYQAYEQATQNIRHRYSNTDTLNRTRHRYAIEHNVENRIKHKYNANPELEMWAGIEIGLWDLAWKYGVSDVSYSFLITGSSISGTKDLSQYVEFLEYRYTQSDSIEWEIGLTDEFGLLHSKRSGPWAGVIDEAGLDTTGTPRKILNVKYTWGGKEFTFEFVPTGVKRSRRAATGRRYIKGWMGKDHAQKLKIEAQNMSVIRSTKENPIMSFDVLRDICNAYHVELDLSGMPSNTDNFPIYSYFRVNGIPEEWIKDILGASMAEYRMRNGKILTPYVYGLSAPVAVYDSTAIWEEEDNEANINAIYTVVTVIRASESGAAAYSNENLASNPAAIDGWPAPAAGEDVFEFREYEVSFPQPLDCVYHRELNMNGGVFSNIKYYNATGGLMAVRQPRAPFLAADHPGLLPTEVFSPSLVNNGLVVACTRVTFEWTPMRNFVGSGATGTIQFFGTLHDEDQEPGTPEDPAPSFRATYPEPADWGTHPCILKYGVRPIEIPGNPLLHNKAFAQQHARRYWFRLMNQGEDFVYKVKHNPEIVNGVTVCFIDELMEFEFYIVVKEAVHRLVPVPDLCSTTLIGNLYLATCA